MSTENNNALLIETPSTTSNTTSQKTDNSNKYIKTFTSDCNLFGLSFKSSKDKLPFATSSLNMSTNNKIEIVEIDSSTDKLKSIASTPTEFPCSSVMFSPDESTSDTFISTSDFLYIYKYADQKITKTGTLTKNNPTYYGPLTSCDWCRSNNAIVGVSSVDTTCTIWDLNKMDFRANYIAHDKEVFDISLGPDEFTFMTTGADGCVRLFDTRTQDTFRIIFETSDGTPMTTIDWNLHNTNLILVPVLDKNEIYILDQRNSFSPFSILKDHTNVVNNARWAPNSYTNLVSVGDDKKAFIWEISTETIKPEEVILEYEAEKEIENVDWGEVTEDWVGIVYGNSVECLKIKE